MHLQQLFTWTQAYVRQLWSKPYWKRHAESHTTHRAWKQCTIERFIVRSPFRSAVLSSCRLLCCNNDLLYLLFLADSSSRTLPRRTTLTWYSRRSQIIRLSQRATMNPSSTFPTITAHHTCQWWQRTAARSQPPAPSTYSERTFALSNICHYLVREFTLFSKISFWLTYSFNTNICEWHHILFLLPVLAPSLCQTQLELYWTTRWMTSVLPWSPITLESLLLPTTSLSHVRKHHNNYWAITYFCSMYTISHMRLFFTLSLMHNVFLTSLHMLKLQPYDKNTILVKSKLLYMLRISTKVEIFLTYIAIFTLN